MPLSIKILISNCQQTLAFLDYSSGHIFGYQHLSTYPYLIDWRNNFIAFSNFSTYQCAMKIEKGSASMIECRTNIKCGVNLANHGGKRENAGRPRGQGKFGEITVAMRIPESQIELLSI